MSETSKPAPSRLTLRKGEKLRHKSLVDRLFAKGAAEYCYPLRMQWHILSRTEAAEGFKTGLPPRVDPLQMMITVPKRKMRHAVDRVLLRRRIREAYRLQRLPLKTRLAADSDKVVSLSFIYIADSIKGYDKISRAVATLLARLEEVAYPSAREEQQP